MVSLSNYQEFIHNYRINEKKLSENQKILINHVLGFLKSVKHSWIITRVMILFLHFCKVPSNIIAPICNFTDRNVRNIKRTFKERGDRCFIPMRAPGPEKKITPHIHGEMVKYMVQNPASTIRDIIEWLARKFGLSVSYHTIKRELGNFNLSDLTEVLKKTTRSLLVPDGEEDGC